VGGTTATLGALVTASALHAHLAATAVQLNVGSIDLTFHGSLLDWLLNLFKGYIEKQVRSGLTSAFAAAIASVITTQINPALAAMPMALPIPAPPPYNFTVVRFGLTDSPAFTPSFMAVDLQGDVVPAAAGGRDPPITPPALPPWTAASADYAVQLQMSQYTPESAIYAYYAAGELQWLLPPSQLPFGLNKTSSYAPIAPGLPAAWPNAPVSLNVSFAALPNVTISPAGVAIAAPLLLGFIVAGNHSDTPTAFTLLAETTFAGAITARAANGSAPAALLARIAYLNASLSTQSTAVGPVNTALLQALADFVFGGIIVPEVNALIAGGLPLPQIGGVTLISPAVFYGDGYLTVATNFSFTPPKAPLRGQAALEAALAGGRVDLLAEDALLDAPLPMRTGEAVDLLADDVAAEAAAVDLLAERR